jgi:Helix-turn-helix domain of resolvase
MIFPAETARLKGTAQSDAKMALRGYLAKKPPDRGPADLEPLGDSPLANSVLGERADLRRELRHRGRSPMRSSFFARLSDAGSHADPENIALELRVLRRTAKREFERNLIRERTLAGLKAARARGRNGGRPKKLNPKELKTIRTLLRSNEVPVQDIAAQFGVNRSTLYRNMTAPTT